MPSISVGELLVCRGKFGEDENRKDRRDLAVTLIGYLVWIPVVVLLAPRLPSRVGDYSLLTLAGVLVTLTALLVVNNGRRVYSGPVLED